MQVTNPQPLVRRIGESAMIQQSGDRVMKTVGIVLAVVVVGSLVGYAAWDLGPLLWAIVTGNVPKGYQGLL